MRRKSEVKRVPLLSWDISSPYYRVKQQKSEELQLLMKFAREYSWSIDLRRELSTPYEALVLTDLDQNIVYVNPGFQAMTGYSPDFAIGKKPTFLQGKSTSLTTRNQIRAKLSAEIPFSGSLVNYRNNGEAYLCEISIFPLHNSSHELTHFLAIEKELPAFVSLQ
ncbi:PAS domain-containing protein [Algoriphagus halophytocola]|uniref:PAS domain-containing protein n=1 Tax=Algoriphagus halophytocola TaxID=2991499 RepID=A0ABY6MIE0_9BACT|nr:MULTISPECIES: PAS domain-containing protein [unclassified Algoriphagus]UZD23562.1 PAS domain-containing protein [Algoriphagus sp. TR-M5]WBL44856.1 PAS domain-containing protein [Algoriphagus sp. TR-M9]